MALLSSCARTLYGLRVFRAHGLSQDCLEQVFRLTVPSMVRNLLRSYINIPNWNVVWWRESLKEVYEVSRKSPELYRGCQRPLPPKSQDKGGPFWTHYDGLRAGLRNFRTWSSEQGPPHSRGPTHMRQKIMRSSTHYWHWNCMTKNSTEHGHLAFHFDPVGRPHIIFWAGPPHLLIRPWVGWKIYRHLLFYDW